LTFNTKQRAVVERWVGRAAPLQGVYFRSVEYRYMDPKDVLNGAGTRKYGGRFAPKGIRAIYLSATDSGASKEVTARKSRLGGTAQISTGKYPRVVYAVAVDLQKTLDLSDLGISLTGKAVVKTCLALNDLEPSMDLARELQAGGIQALLFPSVLSGDNNLVVYRANCGWKALVLQNEGEVIEQAKRIAAKYK
jgi:RES domain-containing protein